MAWSQMIDLELDDEDKMDAILPMPMAKPDYPPGTCMCLNEKIIGKLGLDMNVEIGDLLDTRIFFEVTDVHKGKGADGEPTCRVEIQAIRMKVENESGEDEQPGS